MEAYTIPEAARAAGLSPREVRMRIEEGDLRAVIRAGRRMVERTELERLLDPPVPLRPAKVAEVGKLEQELAEARRELARARQRIAELESAGRRPALTALFQSTEPEPG